MTLFKVRGKKQTHCQYIIISLSVKSGLWVLPASGKLGVWIPAATDLSRKKVVTAELLNARQKMWVSRVLGDYHYKRISRVTEGVTRKRILTARCPWVPSIGQNLQPFTGNCDVSIWGKILAWDDKPQTNKQKINQAYFHRCHSCL